jgi:hypothetical protein
MVRKYELFELRILLEIEAQHGPGPMPALSFSLHESAIGVEHGGGPQFPGNGCRRTRQARFAKAVRGAKEKAESENPAATPVVATRVKK